MADKAVGSYLYELKPYIDTQAWKKASGDISKAIKSSNISTDEWKEKKDSFKKQLEEAGKLQSKIESLVKMQKSLEGSSNPVDKERYNAINQMLNGDGKRTKGLLGDKKELLSSIRESQIELEAQEGNVGSKLNMQQMMSGFASKISAVSGSLTAFYSTLKKAITGSMELVEKQAEVANKLNATGAFGNMSTRDMMARYGVNSTRANAMSSALSMMGLSESDIGRMNSAQKKMYDELIDYYEQGMNKIDSTKLKEYYAILDEYQEKQAKWKIDLQTTILKMFSESESFNKLTGSLENFFEKSIEFLELDAVQWFFDTFIEFLSSIVDTASSILGFFGSGSSSGTTNNTSNQSTNTYYIYGGNSSSNQDLARQIALEQTSAQR